MKALADAGGYSVAEVRARLLPMVAGRRLKRLEDVAALRTDLIVPVVEGLYDLGNIGAVMRTAEGFGVQEMHVISTMANERYKQSRSVSSGAEKWLDAIHWDGTKDCISLLRSRGYRIAVAHCELPVTSSLQTGGLHSSSGDGGGDSGVSASTTSKAVSCDLGEVDFETPVAIFFGNEHAGVSKEAVDSADICFRIPVAGFVQSYNVSVAAAITLQAALGARRARAQQPGHDRDRCVNAGAPPPPLSTAHYANTDELATEFLARSVMQGTPAKASDLQRAIALLESAATTLSTTTGDPP